MLGAHPQPDHTNIESILRKGEGGRRELAQLRVDLLIRVVRASTYQECRVTGLPVVIICSI